MILGLGLDVVEVARLEAILAGDNGARFADRVFTPAERAYCDEHVARALHYAGRFAAKEALVKALGAPSGMTWQDMEISSGGPPAIASRGRAAEALSARGVKSVHLSLSHDGGLAVAAVILEG
ncbi:MAG: holo-ACP synthase [Deltaproteobacteria bacterium]